MEPPRESARDLLRSRYEEEKPAKSSLKLGRGKPREYFEDDEEDFPELPLPAHLKEAAKTSAPIADEEEPDELDAFMAGVESSVSHPEYWG